MATDSQSFIVRFDIRQEGEHFYAKCDQIPGLYVGGDSREAVLESAQRAAVALMKANRGMDVEVSPIDEDPRWANHTDRFVVQLAAA